MTVKKFLSKVNPTLQVKIWDLDKSAGNNMSQGEAGEMALKYHFNYHLMVEDFLIENDCIIIYAKRGWNMNTLIHIVTETGIIPDLLIILSGLLILVWILEERE